MKNQKENFDMHKSHEICHESCGSGTRFSWLGTRISGFRREISCQCHEIARDFVASSEVGWGGYVLKTVTKNK